MSRYSLALERKLHTGHALAYGVQDVRCQHPRPDSATAEPQMIELRHVHKWYGQFRAQGHQPDGVQGERIVICGPSGSGKSTMIRCINRLEEHQDGQIIVDGTELTDDIKHIDQIRREVGMAFQHFNLFPHLTGAGELLLCADLGTQDAAQRGGAGGDAIPGKVKIPEQAKKYPGQLSGGPAAARCDRPQPVHESGSIMLFDEPTSALDPR